MENRAIIKYNGGMGAVLCNSCGCIVRAGAKLTEEDKSCLRGQLALPEQYCNKCKEDLDYITDEQLLKEYSLKIKDMKVRVINDKPMPGNDIGPDIKIGEEHELGTIYTCKCGEKHYDIYLPLDVNFVECYKCRETLPEYIRWCHSSRFVEV